MEKGLRKVQNELIQHGTGMNKYKKCFRIKDNGTDKMKENRSLVGIWLRKIERLTTHYL